MKALSLHTSAQKLHCEDNTSFISIFEAKRFTPRVKHIDIPVCFLQEQINNSLFIPRYEKSSVMPENMCTKLCSGPIISWSTKLMTGLILYPISDT